MTPHLWLSTVCLYGSHSSYNQCLAKYLALALSLLSNYYLTQFTVYVSIFSDLSSLLLKDAVPPHSYKTFRMLSWNIPLYLGPHKTNVIFSAHGSWKDILRHCQIPLESGQTSSFPFNHALSGFKVSLPLSNSKHNGIWSQRNLG